MISVYELKKILTQNYNDKKYFRFVYRDMFGDEYDLIPMHIADGKITEFKEAPDCKHVLYSREKLIDTFIINKVEEYLYIFSFSDNDDLYIADEKIDGDIVIIYFK